MSSNHHTPIPTNSPANAAIFNAPMGQLDSAIGGILAGTKLFTQMAFASATTKTIASGVITPTQNLHLVAAETGTADSLDTITAVNNSILFLKADSGDTITLTEFGNITNTPITLSGNKIVALFCQNSQWCVIGGDSSAAAKGYIAGLEINITSDIAYGVAEGVCLDDTHTVMMELTAHAGAISSSGINGLDTGVEASNTWYYVWVIKGSSGTETILSTSATAPTLPAGYDSYKRRIGIIRNDASSNLLRQFMPAGQGMSRRVYWREDCRVAPFLIANSLNVPTSPTYQTLDFSAVVPPTSRMAIISTYTPGTAAGSILWRLTAGEGEHMLHRAQGGSNTASAGISEVPITSTQTLDITGESGDEDLDLYVDGYFDDITPNLV